MLYLKRGILTSSILYAYNVYIHIFYILFLAWAFQNISSPLIVRVRDISRSTIAAFTNIFFVPVAAIVILDQKCLSIIYQILHQNHLFLYIHRVLHPFKSGSEGVIDYL